MNRLFPVLLGTLLIATSVVGVNAYTSATVDRTSNINVAADNNAIIGLNPGTDSAIALNASDELEINTAQNASGVNPGATFVYGDTADPTNTYAFQIVNNDSVSRSFNFSYSGTSTSGVTFTVYDGGGNQVGTFDEASSVTNSIPSGGANYVVLEVNTNGLSSADDLSGTVTITS